MLNLLGFSSSNYYNTVKLALLEKGVPFQETTVYPGADPEYLARSPLGKVPCLETEAGPLVESRPILDYLEERYPERPLLPQGAFARAQVRRSMQFIELYLELEVRKHLPYFFAGQVAPEPQAEQSRRTLHRAASRLPDLLDFSAYLTGPDFGLLDVWAALHFPVVSSVASRTLGHDPLGDVPGVADYLARMQERPHVARVNADRKADFAPFVEHIKRRYGLG